MLWVSCGALLWGKLNAEPLPSKKAEIEQRFRTGEALFEQGRIAEARSVFQEVDVPDYMAERKAQKYHNIAAALLRLGQEDEAVAALKEALKYDPNDAGARQMLKELQPGTN